MSPAGDRKGKVKVEQEGDSAKSRFSKLKLINNNKFSRFQLAGFVLVFAAIGGYLLFRSFAAAPVVATIQAEQMTPNGVNPASGFTTSLTNGMSVSAPYIWTFNPGVATTAGYFWADGKLLSKVSGPGPYAFRLSSGLLANGLHSLGHAWDTTGGVHQTPPGSYSVTISNSGGTGFVTSLTSGMTIKPPYIWAFDPGTATTAGYFWADGKQLSKISGPGPYIYYLQPGTLSVGAHKFGHAWNTATGKHQTASKNYNVTIGSPASTSSSYSIINDSTASGGQAVKFGGSVSLSGSVALGAASTSLTVMAHGEQCSTSWPQMIVTVDGATVINTSVSSATWTGYTANINLTAGTHTLNISNTSGGNCQPNLYVDVTNFFGQTVVASPPTVALSASPSSLTAGQSSTLTWSSTNAGSCTGSGAWSGSQPTSGSVSTGALNQNSTYTLVCTGSGGNASGSATITVNSVSGGTCPSGNTAWCSATNFPTPAFTPTRTIDVSSQSAFMTAWNNLQPGDQINVHGVTFTGEVVLANKKLSNWAQISFDSNTHFVGPAAVQNLPDVWIHDDSHIRFYGGDFNNSASGGMDGTGILLYGNSYITMWGFKAHDTGGDAISIFPVSSVDDHLDIKGEVYDWGHNLSWDPHTEKGSGLHGLNIGDANYGVTNSRIALYAHDGKTGAGIEWGGKDTYGNFQNNTIYAWCQNLTFVSVLQTGGNCLQVWGQNVFNNTISYLEAENLQGRPYNAGGMYSGQSLATDSVQYGRATNTNLNTAKFGSVRWDTTDGTAFKNVSPLP